jgi:hypothetical protein
MRSTVVSGATFVPVGGPTGLEAPSAIDGIIERTGKGTGPGIDERLETPKVQVDEQLASLWAYRTLTLPGETKIDDCGYDVYLLRKGPDGWRIFQNSGYESNGRLQEDRQVARVVDKKQWLKRRPTTTVMRKLE